MRRPKVPALPTKKTTTTKETCTSEDLRKWRDDLTLWLGVTVSQARIAKEAKMSAQAIDSFERGGRSVPESVIQAVRRLTAKVSRLRELGHQTGDADLVFLTADKLYGWHGAADEAMVRALAEEARKELDAAKEVRFAAAVEKGRLTVRRKQEKKSLRARLRAEKAGA